MGKSTRKFNGQQFKRVGNKYASTPAFYYKRDATDHASKRRKKGWNARVVKQSLGYDVYVRRK